MVKPEKYFYLEDGGVLKNIKELAMKLDSIEDEIFRRHVNELKNDFANWIEHVFKEKKLAERLRELKDKKDFQIELLKFLVVKHRTKNFKKYICKECGKSFSSKVGLSVHKTIVHTKQKRGGLNDRPSIHSD